MSIKVETNVYEKIIRGENESMNKFLLRKQNAKNKIKKNRAKFFEYLI